MGKGGFMRRALCCALLSCTVFLTSCFPQTHESAPAVPLESLTPWAAHVVPFFEFAGGKEGSIAGPDGGGLIVDSKGNFYGASESGGIKACPTYLGPPD